MRQLRAFLIRLGGCLRRTRGEQELNDEIESHLQLHIDDNLRAGMSPEEARRDAVLKLGGSIEPVKEAIRDRQRLPWLESVAQDVRFAFRSLRKSPGFTTVAVLTLALCIGANSAVFSVVHAILLKPYPWPDSDRLVYVLNNSGLPVSITDYLDRRNGMASLEESALFSGRTNLNLAATDVAPERVAAVTATPSLFSLLKARPALGRTFSEDDAQIGAPKTVVLSDALWRNRFGANPKIIGTDIRLNGEPHTVIGVMSPAFYFPTPDMQMWLPFAFTDQQKSDAARGRRGSSVMVGRLKPGATIEQALRETTSIQKANAERFPQFKALLDKKGVGVSPRVNRFVTAGVGEVRAMLWLIQSAVAGVLLIGCVNVASLLLARASARERELAIRAALGASRGRLMRHLLTESLLLFLTGGLLGLLLASWGVSAMNHLGVRNLPRSFEVSLDLTVVAFTLLCAAATGLAFGALPAWSATRGNQGDALKDAGARATTARRHVSLRSTLVVAEIALTLMLLATAALLIKSFHRVQEVDPGFVRDNVLTAWVSAPQAKYPPGQEKGIAFYSQLLEHVRALPGVTSAGWTTEFPFSFGVGNGYVYPYTIEGHAPVAGQPESEAAVRWVSPDYFKTMGIRLLRGRVFTEQDTRTADRAIVLDKIFADRCWPGEDPIGRRVTVTMPGREWKCEIIGVVTPVNYLSLEAPITKETLYFSMLQGSPGGLALVMKTATPPSQLTALLRAAVQAIDPQVPVFGFATMEAVIEKSTERRRTPMTLLAIFAGLSLLLAALGVYGVLAFAVGQRTQEIGVRMALGATRANILQLVLGQGIRLLAIGLVLGLGGYFALSTFVRKMLFSVETTDFAALLIAPATLALVALAACLIPARRATKVDPIVALRAE